MMERPHNPIMDALLGHARPVLDHGFIRVVDYMGGDEAIVQAARVSYGTGTKSVSDDRALIRYLMRHWHTTPFEMAEIKLHVKLPIFVARQWIRHRMASVNEYSARYSVLDREFYVPSEDVIASQSSTNRQGRGEAVNPKEAASARSIMESSSSSAYDHYIELLNETPDGREINSSKFGLARELARTVLPVSCYTQWYWKIDLHNLLNFLALRADTHAQYEIRVYALEILEVLKAWVPNTYEAFIDYKLNSFNLSRGALEAVRGLINGNPVDATSCGLSSREWAELMVALKSN